MGIDGAEIQYATTKFVFTEVRLTDAVGLAFIVASCCV
jgi:hypothetical protein